MKTKRIPKFLGLGLAVALAFSLGAGIGITPASADVHEWSTINTPSWEDNVIAPGSDIYDYAVGPDGETIYAVGAIKGGDDNVGLDSSGVSGYFYIASGSINIDAISSDVANFTGDFNGWACVIRGEFSSYLELAWDGSYGYAAISGEVTDDKMTFSGRLYLESGSLPADGDYDCDEEPICIDDNYITTPTLALGFFDVSGNSAYYQPRIWKSTDGGVTWDNITAAVQDTDNLPAPFFIVTEVAVAPDDEDWLALGGHDISPIGGQLMVVASQDGGDSFSYTGDLVDTDNGTEFASLRDMAVSIEVDGIHNIALAGTTVYRLQAGTWLTGSWEDTSFYDGWDNGVTYPPTKLVVSVDFSPNFDIDQTVVCLGWDDVSLHLPYLQSGTFEDSGGDWNDEAGFSEAVEITDDGNTLTQGIIGRCSMGLALPVDYDGSDPGARTVFGYVDAYNTATDLYGGYVFRIDDDSVSEPFGPSGNPLLASIDFYGDADTGKMIVGEYIGWNNDAPDEGEPIPAECCDGVRVWHTVELDPCCPDWELACKSPSGPYMAQVKYTPDGEKAYATTRGFVLDFWDDMSIGLADESAFSVSLDNGVSFNQLGLIDTDIDYLSDLAVCPDCSVIYLSSINRLECWTCSECVVGDDSPEALEICEYCGCDSVWRSYDNGDTWERIYHGDWVNEPWGDGNLLLRLPCEDTEDCCTLYLGVQYTDELYYTRDCGQCWTQTPGTKILIQDFAVDAENEVMVIDSDGYFSMSTQFGRRWTDEVDTEIGSGHVIASCCLDDLVVVAGAADEPVAFSKDMGETWELTEDLPGDTYSTAHIACDPTCEGTIYAALSGPVGACGGIYRWVIDESSEWDNLNAYKYGYYGIVVSRSDGTLYAASNNIHVDLDSDICDRFVDPNDPGFHMVYSGVARDLDPCETACCGEESWDYLVSGLTVDNEEEFTPGEWFSSEPSALRICGCLSMTTPSILWAIDLEEYDVTDGSDGTLWTYEDCTAKQAPELLSPMCGEDIESEPCEGCTNVDINLCWTKICDACTYDIEIATDEDFNQPIYQYYYWDGEDLDCFAPSECANPCYLIPHGALEAGTTYYWHVRVHGEETGENARSQWSETCSFNVMSGVGLYLLAPENGSMGIGIESVGFSWTSISGATSYSFVFSESSDLSGALASEELSSTAYTYSGTLDYSTPYFWQVTAWKDGSELATSDIGSFTTAAEPKPLPEPPPAEPAPEVVIPPAQQITPNWIIAMIAIGAALAVLVIVLIVRTRRP